MCVCVCVCVNMHGTCGEFDVRNDDRPSGTGRWRNPPTKMKSNEMKSSAAERELQPSNNK